MSWYLCVFGSLWVIGYRSRIVRKKERKQLIEGEEFRKWGIPMSRYGKNLVHYIIVEHDDQRGQKPIDDDDEKNFYYHCSFTFETFFRATAFLLAPAVCAVREVPCRLTRTRYNATEYIEGMGGWYHCSKVWVLQNFTGLGPQRPATALYYSKSPFPFCCSHPSEKMPPERSQWSGLIVTYTVEPDISAVL